MFETEAGFAETKMLINCHGDYSKKQDYKKGWQDGAEFGYNKAKEEMQEQGLALQSDMNKTIEQNIALKKELNKANEWHYVKDGDLPTKELEEKPLLVTVRNYTEDVFIAYYMLDGYCRKNGKRFYPDNNCEFPFDIKDVIAWKEIVLPKEAKNEL